MGNLKDLTIEFKNVDAHSVRDIFTCVRNYNDCELNFDVQSTGDESVDKKDLTIRFSRVEDHMINEIFTSIWNFSEYDVELSVYEAMKPAITLPDWNKENTKKFVREIEDVDLRVTSSEAKTSA